MTTDTTPPDDVDSGIRARMQEICDRHTQAEVARVCGISRANVSRYLSGNRIPASVCGALVKGLGVNPSWLLTGEGSPFLADIHAGHGQMATDLLEVVDAMNAVAKMRLGALAGKQHLKALRELDDALRTYETLRERLNVHSRPILKQLLDDWDKAFQVQRPERSRQLRRAADQVMRLCDDDELELRLMQTRAMDDMLHQEKESSLANQRRAALGRIVNTGNWSDEALLAVQRVIFLLEGIGRLEESTALCRAVQILAQFYGGSKSLIARLDAQIGDVMTETGRIIEGLPLLQRAISTIQDSSRPTWQALWAYAQYMAGTVEFEQIAIEPEGPGNQMLGEILSRICTWTENPKHIERAQHIYDILRGESTNEPVAEAIVCRWIVRAAQAPTAETLAGALAELEPQTREVERHPHKLVQLRAHEAQLAQLCGQPDTAREALDVAADLLHSLPEGVAPYMIGPSVLYRLALRLHENATTPRHRRLYAEARAWFVKHYDSGYGRFRDLASD
ncbi:MAG: helix-turn-helix transcriptional regulator [Planctomycetes bacterium]|nr:helix-turn-helix transcriptional regulator [Planctomycetota bacterium]